LKDTLRKYVGIDPGVSGGVAIIGADGLKAHKCPPTILDMCETLRYATTGLSGFQGVYCVIESVHSMPGQGVASTFKFGKNFGQWLGILASLQIPYREVTPHKWMKHYGALPKDKTQRKNHLKHLAQQRYPSDKITLSTADAVLLAVYGKESVTW